MYRIAGRWTVITFRRQTLLEAISIADDIICRILAAGVNILMGDTAGTKHAEYQQ
jgi:hypothetical protein